MSPVKLVQLAVSILTVECCSHHCQPHQHTLHVVTLEDAVLVIFNLSASTALARLFLPTLLRVPSIEQPFECQLAAIELPFKGLFSFKGSWNEEALVLCADF